MNDKLRLTLAYSLLTIILLILPSLGTAQLSHLFESEKMIFKMVYLKFPAGTLIFQLRGLNEHNGVPCYRLDVQAETNAVFSPLFGIKNRYESCFDTTTFLPYYLKKEIHQKNIEQIRTIQFDHENNVAQIGDSIRWDIPPASLGFFSMVYFLRKQRFSEQDTISFNLDSENLPSRGSAYIIGRKKIPTSLGAMDALKVGLSFEPLTREERPWKTDLLTNRLANPYAKISFWFSDDDLRLPLIIEFEQKHSKAKLILEEHFIN